MKILILKIISVVLIFLICFSVYRFGFFSGTRYGESLASEEGLPSVSHSFKNLSVSKSVNPYVVTLRVSYEDGFPCSGVNVMVVNDSGFLSGETDANGFVKFYYGKSNFDTILVKGFKPLRFNRNEYLKPVDLIRYGLDFTIILNRDKS